MKTRTAALALFVSMLAATLAAGPAPSVPVAGVVNINTASAAQLALLPGVGDRTALAIIAARPFAAPQDVTRVHGIKGKRFTRIAAYLTVTGQTTLAAKVRTARRARR
jgi:competence protein ComEA